MEARTLNELPGWAIELLRDGRVARMGMLDESDRPRVLPVTYALQGGAIWSAIDRKPKQTPEPARLRYLHRRPEAALTVDRYSEDWDDLAWVQVLGRIDVRELSEATAGLEELVRKYAPYRAEQPPGPLLRLTPERILFWQAVPQ